MKILITGGCGFIGTNTALYFAEKGHKVIVMDNLSRKGSEINAELLKRNKKIFFKCADIESDFNSLMFFIDDIDVVIHAAAQVAVTSSVTDPVSDFEINSRGTLNILEAARKAIKKPIVIFTSTNKVYGEMKDVELTEEENRYTYKDKHFGIPEEQNLDFHSPYGCSKGCADQYVRDYYRIYGLPTVVFRQSCIYGLHQFGIVDQGWVSFLTMSALFDKPIIIFGDGKQVRDVLFMDDLSRAFEKAILFINKTKGRIYNIGGGPENTISVIGLISILSEILGKKIDPTFADWRSGDQKVYISDIRKAEKEFSWKPEASFKEGFDLMLEWIRQNEKILKEFI
ncbi:MAG: SDR family NAD(P)-dependent oxidoreductase [Patescibacteria group bacterium]